MKRHELKQKRHEIIQMLRGRTKWTNEPIEKGEIPSWREFSQLEKAGSEGEKRASEDPRQRRMEEGSEEIVERITLAFQINSRLRLVFSQSEELKI